MRGGLRPPLDPRRVLRAIRAAGTSTDDELASIVGLPSFATGCGVSGDPAAFAAGESVELSLHARITEEAPDTLIISHLPPDSSTNEIATLLQARLDMAASGRDAALPIRDIHDASAGGHARLVLRLSPGASAADVRIELDKVWSIRRSVTARLARPLAHLVRAFSDDAGAHDVEQRLEFITASIRID